MSWQAPKTFLNPYLICVAAVAAATAIRLVFDPWLSSEDAYLTYFGAVAIAVWAGGYGPGIAATVLGLLTAVLVFVPPRGQLGIASVDNVFAVVAYLISCGLILAIGEALRRAKTEAARDRDHLNVALGAARMTAFDVDVESNKVTRSENAASFFGINPIRGTLHEVTENIHPEDRSLHEAAIRQTRSNGDYFCRFRFIRPLDKRQMWVEAHGKVIRDRNGSLKRLCGVAMDVTETVSLETRIAGHSEAIARESERKSQFIATLAHELRNPLAPIKNCMALMSDPRTGEHATKSALQVMKRQVHAIERLIEDLLDTSRIEQGKMAIYRQRTDLAGMLKKAVEAAYPNIEAKRQRLSVALPRQSLGIDADEGRLIQVMLNLLNNSSKFTPAGGSISLAARRENDQVKIVVEDSGIGIPCHQLDAIFEAFVQSGRQRANSGLGLGLSLSKAIVEMHGGTIQAQSEGAGRGSRFTIRLPISAQDRLAERLNGSAIEELH